MLPSRSRTTRASRHGDHVPSRVAAGIRRCARGRRGAACDDVVASEGLTTATREGARESSADAVEAEHFDQAGWPTRAALGGGAVHALDDVLEQSSIPASLQRSAASPACARCDAGQCGESRMSSKSRAAGCAAVEIERDGAEHARRSADRLDQHARSPRQRRGAQFFPERIAEISATTPVAAGRQPPRTSRCAGSPGPARACAGSVPAVVRPPQRRGRRTG